MNFSDKKALTLQEACEYLHYSRSSILKFTACGILPFSKPGGRKLFFDREKLDEWLLQNSNPGLPAKQVEAVTFVQSKLK